MNKDTLPPLPTEHMCGPGKIYTASQMKEYALQAIASASETVQPASKPKCWCKKCRPITLDDMRMVVCPDCGDKRCQHAADHDVACIGIASKEEQFRYMPQVFSILKHAFDGNKKAAASYGYLMADKIDADGGDSSLLRKHIETLEGKREAVYVYPVASTSAPQVNHEGKLLPCPFCNCEMGGDYQYFTHPKNDCTLSECEFDGYRRGNADGEDGYDNYRAVQEWNRRSYHPDSAAIRNAAIQDCIQQCRKHWTLEKQFDQSMVLYLAGVDDCYKSILSLQSQPPAAQDGYCDCEPNSCHGKPRNQCRWQAMNYSPIAAEGRNQVLEEVNDDLIDAIEHELGMGHGAWDHVNPHEIVRAVLKCSINNP